METKTGYTMKDGYHYRKKTKISFGLAALLSGCILTFFLYVIWKDAAAPELTVIALHRDATVISGKGAEADGSIVRIKQGGRYRIEGELEDGQIYVDCEDDGAVFLELNGVHIENPSDAAIYIEHAEHTTILLEEGTANRLQSGRKKEKGGDGAVIYANDDLLLTGAGELLVIGRLNHGIQSKGSLRIDGGKIEVEAVGNAVKGKDSVIIGGGDFRISAAGKGIQAKYELFITGGNFTIAESEEGLEANQVIIEGGVFDIYAEDDGINANGGEDKQKKKPSEDIVETMPNLIIRGGLLHINAEGDGLDSNGNLLIEGGEIVIDGPVKDDDGPLDYGKENDGVCKITGGIVLAVGSSGMAETFDESSGQCSFRCLFEESYEAGSEIVIADADGKELYRHTAAKTGASVVFSSPALVQGGTYTLRVGTRTVEIVQDSVSTGK